MYVHTICFRFIHTQEAKNLCKLCELVKSAKYLSTWADGTVTTPDASQQEIRLFEIVQRGECPDDEDPFEKLKTLTIAPDGSCKLYSLGKKIELKNCGLPPKVTDSGFNTFDEQMSQLVICKGNSDQKIIEAMRKRKGVIKHKNVISAYLDNSLVGGLKLDPTFPKTATVRHKLCTILVQKNKQRCKSCQMYRKTLLKLAKLHRLSEYFEAVKCYACISI